MSVFFMCLGSMKVLLEVGEEDSESELSEGQERSETSMSMSDSFVEIWGVRIGVVG